MEVLTQGWSREIIAPLVSKASLQTFQDAELVQTHAKFEHELYFRQRGCHVGLFWARLTTLAASSVVRLVWAAVSALLN